MPLVVTLLLYALCLSYNNSHNLLNSDGPLINTVSAEHCPPLVGPVNPSPLALAKPITFSKSFVKQLMDYPRCLGYTEKHKYSDKMAQLLGYDSRVPANLYEWYQPFESRLYKKEQD